MHTAQAWHAAPTDAARSYMFGHNCHYWPGDGRRFCGGLNRPLDRIVLSHHGNRLQPGPADDVCAAARIC